MTAQEIFNNLVESRRGALPVDQFLQPSYEFGLDDPWLLPDMPRAVDRLVEASQKSQKVCVYGDYDIDGLTASTLMLEVLSAWGIAAYCYIPSRFTEGYGLNVEAVKQICNDGADLIITVDCGSLSIAEVAVANANGVDVIITDHHTVGEELPDAIAVINPKRTDSKYPHPHLAGVGVAFKLVQAVQTKIRGLPQGHEKWLLDLVALGTVCDMVPLIGENRTLVKYGLKVAQKSRRPGFQALANVAGCELARLTAEDFGFRFGPRLNASGRLSNATASLQLLQAESSQLASKLATELDLQNSERRNIQNQITDEALRRAEESNDEVLVLADEHWSHGVVGIVAAKVMRKVKRPTIVMQILGDKVKGSGRSFGDFDLSKALEKVRPLLLTGGGHMYAAGFGLQIDQLEEFTKILNDYYRSLGLKDHGKSLNPEVDLELADTSALDIELARLLNEMEPFGQANPQPVFAVDGLSLIGHKPMGRTGDHGRFMIRDQRGLERQLVCFGRAKELASSMGSEGQLRAIVTLGLNTFMGRTSAQIQITDWQIIPS